MKEWHCKHCGFERIGNEITICTARTRGGPDTLLCEDERDNSTVPGELADWWAKTFKADFDAMAPKIGEYSSADLTLMGGFMELWLDLPKGSGAEAACLFYALGKVARAVAAYREGKVPSEDTLHDLVVYGMMARRIRTTGGWP